MWVGADYTLDYWVSNQTETRQTFVIPAGEKTEQVRMATLFALSFQYWVN